MISKSTIEIFKRASKNNAWDQIFNDYDMNSLIAAALECDEVKVNILKEIMGLKMFNKISNRTINSLPN